MSISPSIASSIASPLVGPLSGGGEAAPFIPVNLIGFSEAFNNAAWSKVRLSVSADAGNGPTGAATADKLIATSDDTDHKISKGISGITNGATYTFSVYLKMAGLRWVAVYNAVGKGRYFDLQDGAKGSAFVGAPPADTIIDAGDGWWRCSVTAVATSTTMTPFIYLVEGNGDASFIGNDADGVLAWGAQLEIGGIVNQYAPVP